MKNHLLIFFLFILVRVGGYTQEIVPLSSEDFPEAVVGKPEIYDVTSIMTYNDGSDIFLEMGFRSLIVQEIAWEYSRYKVEIFNMTDPESAFGIYKLTLLKCRYQDTLTSHDCAGEYQYIAAFGTLFISITGDAPQSGPQDFFLLVAGRILKKNPQGAFDLPEPFNQGVFKQSRSNLVYLRGPVGLQNSLFPWQEIFLGVRFSMYAISLAFPDNDIWFARIRFETPDDQFRFLELAGLTQAGEPLPNTNTNDGIYREYKSLDSQTIHFLQSQEPYPIERLLQRNQ